MSGDVSEAILIEQAAAGDRAALTQLLLLHHDALRRHVKLETAADANPFLAADDVLQQTFVRAAQSISRFEVRPGASFRGWLKTIASNLIKDARKRQSRQRRAGGPPRGWSVCSDDGSVAQLVEQLAGDHTPPLGRAAKRESIRRMRTALASLPPNHREVIERYYLLDQSLQQIADAMGSTKNAIRGICYRARKDLRVMMGESSLYFSS